MSTNANHSLEIARVPAYLCPACFKPITPHGPPIFNADNCSCHEVGTTHGDSAAGLTHLFDLPDEHSFTAVLPTARVSYPFLRQKAATPGASPERQSFDEPTAMSHANSTSKSHQMPRSFPGQKSSGNYSLERYLNQKNHCSSGASGSSRQSSRGSSKSHHHSSHSSFDSTRVYQGSSSKQTSSKRSSSRCSERSFRSLRQEVLNGAGYWNSAARSYSAPAILRNYYDDLGYAPDLDISDEGSYYS